MVKGRHNTGRALGWGYETGNTFFPFLDTDSEADAGPVRSAFADQLSSLGSDSTSSQSTGGESSIYRG